MGNKCKIFKKGSKQSGITLVALVVTIVVLLILAGVSIRLVLDNNGIITRAGDAKDKHGQGRVNDQTDLNSAVDYINQMTGENGGGSGGGSLPTGTGTTPYYPGSNFTQVSGTTLDNGLVIEDGNKNQYVWVEVPKTSEVYPTAGTAITEFTDAEYTLIETDLHTYTNDYRNGTKYKDEYNSDATTGLTSEAYSALKKKMLKSVYQNGGFWIGRYEAGIGTNRTSHSEIADDLVPISKANQYPLTYVYCSEAQTLASRVLPSGGTYTSSLMFGVQWDLVLKYLETKGTVQADLKTDSTSWGNYCDASFTINRGKYAKNGALSSDWNEYNTSLENCVKYENGISTKLSASSSSNGIILTTGSSDTCKKQNIYDLAGNVLEWTLEYTSDSSSPCAKRGGGYNLSGSFYPASYRHSGITTYSSDNFGARVSLY
jgi:hypothetical protein